MIDTEKLKIAHELTKKLDGHYVEILLGCDDEPSIKLMNENLHLHLLTTWNIDELITKLEELNKPKPKYNVGDIVWRLNDEYNATSLLITEIEYNHNEYLYLEHQEYCNEQIRPGWLEEQLYPSRDALIKAQIEYWHKLLNSEID